MGQRTPLPPAAELTKKLWLVCADIGKHMKEAQIPLVASSLAYTTILSIIPFLAVSFSIFQAFKGLDNLANVIQPLILDNLAKESGAEAMEKIQGLIGGIHGKAIGATGFAALIFTSMSMLSSAEKAINRIWATTINRTAFQRISAYWLFITLGPLGLAILVGALSSNDLASVKGALPRGTGGFLLTWCIFFGIYKWVPNRKVNWSPPAIAALITTSLWYIARASYTLYIQKVVSYSKIYGSLGAIPILILWIFVVWVVILSGAAIAASLQKRFDLK